MSYLLDAEWELQNHLVLEMYTYDDSRDFRQNFLRNLRGLVPFDVGEISLMDENYRLYDSVEVNFISNEQCFIAERYNRFKETHGKQVTDFIWKYPKSYIATNSRTFQRE